ncbi:MAG: hypothetical protein MI864_01545 [Pseudomonadales bacterium]|nr:hypothetical protein [Pseudomonadales bacterium]
MRQATIEIEIMGHSLPCQVQFKYTPPVLACIHGDRYSIGPAEPCEIVICSIERNGTDITEIADIEEIEQELIEALESEVAA